MVFSAEVIVFSSPNYEIQKFLLIIINLDKFIKTAPQIYFAQLIISQKISKKVKKLKKPKYLFKKASDKNDLTKKKFWKSIPLTLTNKNVQSDDVSTLDKGGKVIKNDFEVNTCGEPPNILE